MTGRGGGLANLKRKIRHQLPRTQLQPIFERMYGWSLAGMGIGSAVWEVAESGEARLIESFGSELSGAGPTVCVDVGANFGEYARRLVAALGSECSVHCLEPGGEAYERLVVATASEPGIHLHRLALGAEAGSVDFHLVPGHSQLSSLYPLDDWPEAVTETVEVKTLDAWAAEQGIEHIDVLKIDVEGAELGVLQGATELLKNKGIDRIQFEFGARNLRGGASLRDFFELLDGFAIARVVVNGTVAIPRYSDGIEIPISATNYLAVRHGVGQTA